MASWGSTELNVLLGTYQGAWAASKINEIEIIASDTTSPASVIQQCGRGRIRVEFDAYTSSMSGYNTLKADYLTMTPRTFTGPDGYSATMIIFDLGPATGVLPDLWRFHVILMEV